MRKAGQFSVDVAYFQTDYSLFAEVAIVDDSMAGLAMVVSSEGQWGFVRQLTVVGAQSRGTC